MVSVDHGISSLVGTRQSLATAADLVELPHQSYGSYGGFRLFCANRDGEKGHVQLAFQESGQVPVGLKTATYSMSAKNTISGLRDYWVNTTADFTNSPAGSGGYVSGTLTILGKY